MILLSIFSFVLLVLFFALLVIGLVLSRKYSFTAGFYFFLFMIIGQIYSYVIPPFISKYIHSLMVEGNSVSLGMKISMLSGAIEIVITIVAFSFLIVGLYRMWRAKVIKN